MNDPYVPQSRRDRLVVTICYAIVYIPIGMLIAVLAGVFLD